MSPIYRFFLEDLRLKERRASFIVLVCLQVTALAATQASFGDIFLFVFFFGLMMMFMAVTCMSSTSLRPKLPAIRLLPIAGSDVGGVLWLVQLCLPLLIAIATVSCALGLVSLFGLVAGGGITGVSSVLDGFLFLINLEVVVFVSTGLTSILAMVEFRSKAFSRVLSVVIVMYPILIWQQATLIDQLPGRGMLSPTAFIRAAGIVLPATMLVMVYMGIGFSSRTCSGWRPVSRSSQRPDQSDLGGYSTITSLFFHLRGWWALLPVQQWIISTIVFAAFYLGGAYYFDATHEGYRAHEVFLGHAAGSIAVIAWAFSNLGWNFNAQARRVIVTLPVRPSVMTSAIILGNIATVLIPISCMMIWQEMHATEFNAAAVRILLLIIVVVSWRVDLMHSVPRKSWARWINGIGCVLILPMSLPRVASEITDWLSSRLLALMPDIGQTYLVNPIFVAAEATARWSLPLTVCACSIVCFFSWQWIYRSLTAYSTEVPANTKLSWYAEDAQS